MSTSIRPSSVELGPDHALLVPVRSTTDLDRVGPVAVWFAALYDAPIEILTIRCADDVDARDRSEFDRRVEALAGESTANVRLHYVVDDEVAERFLDECAGRAVCMATSANPFRERHFVGSFAAALARRSDHLLLLVGPHAGQPARPYVDVTVAVEPDSQCAVHEAATDLAHRMEVPLRHVAIDVETGSISTVSFPTENDGLSESFEIEMHTEPVATDGLAEAIINALGHSLLAVATSAPLALSWIADGSVSFDLVAAMETPVLLAGPRMT